MPNYIIVTSDDLSPNTLPLFEKYWLPIKKKHPNMKVTFYVSPFNQEFGNDEKNNIATSKEFKKWWAENKDWCTIVPHGYDHTKPPECQRSKVTQSFMVRDTKRFFEKHFGIKTIGWKAPFYRMSEETIDVLRSEGFVWFSQWWNFIPLKVVNRRIPEFVEVPSHTNVPQAKNPDNIDLIYDTVDNTLTQLEKLNFVYSTFDELAKEVIK